jgi:hypothetical protein
MSLEELEQQQQDDADKQPVEILQQQPQRSLSRASTKSDKEKAGKSLADFIKSGRGGTTAPAAVDTAHSNQHDTLPAGLLEAIMGGGQGGSSGGGGGESGGFNFDSIMTEPFNLTSLLGGATNPYADRGGGGAARNGIGDGGGGGGSSRTGSNEEQQQQQSRFSHFFNKAGPPLQNLPAATKVVDQQQQSRRSSIQDELLGNNILREINGEATIRIPSPEEGGSSSKYFTPISPAAKTGGPPQG